MTQDDQRLVTKLEQVVEENLSNEQFGVGNLAKSVGISRSHLHRRLGAISGQSVSQFIREYRLRKALDFLKEGAHSVSEVAYLVGFGSATYFSRSFTSFYGYPPSQAVKIKPDVQEAVSQTNPIVLWLKTPPAKRMVAMLVFVILIPYSVFFIIQLSGRSNESEILTKSVALLPFENLSDESSNAYFSIGVGKAISRKLSAIADLRVVSQTATILNENRHESIIDVAEKLNTSYVLEGSVQKFENMIRVEVGLVNGRTGHRIWSEYFDRKFDDIFQVQNDIAEMVALYMKTTLTPETQSRMDLGYTNNPAAYELYMKAFYEFTSYTRAGYKLAEEYIVKAIKLDSSFALAYSLLGNISIAKGSMFGVELDAREALSQAIIPVRKALEIEPDLPEAHAIKGFYHLYHDWDFQKAELEYKLGLERFNTEGYALYVDFLNFIGRHHEALEFARQLEYNEPYYPNTRMIQSLYFSQNIEEATEFARARVRVMQNYFTLDSYGFLHLNTGKYQEAIEVFQQILEQDDIRYPRILGWMGAAYSRSGQAGKARELIDELKQQQALSSAGSPAFFIAVIYAALEESREALHWLAIAIDEHEMEIPWLITEPQFFALHTTDDFKAMVEKVGFPDF